MTSSLIASSLHQPCSSTAYLFSSDANGSFQSALDTLLPVLSSSASPPAERILAAYILFDLYKGHPIGLNPFYSALHSEFTAEREKGNTEQLVWVLWKILKGDGEDIAPYSPNTLARSPLPPKLQAFHLSLEEDGDSFHALLDAARERSLTLSEIRLITPHISSLTLEPSHLHAITSYNPQLAYLLFKQFLPLRLDDVLDHLQTLPPTLPSFDVYGRLLRDEDAATMEVARSSVPVFISNCISWLDRLEDKDGYQFTQGVQHLCRFYRTLLKLDYIDLQSEVDTTEMLHFSLQNSRMEDANALYRVLAQARF